MSLDIVDDLHAAEDRIGLLEMALENVLALVPPPIIGCDMEEVRIANAVLADPFCRPSCEQEKEWAEDDPGYEHDDCCGCPCHSRDE